MIQSDFLTIGQYLSPPDGNILGEGEDRIQLFRILIVFTLDNNLVFFLKALISPSISLERPRLIQFIVIHFNHMVNQNDFSVNRLLG